MIRALFIPAWKLVNRSKTQLSKKVISKDNNMELTVDFSPPPRVKGMLALNRSAFHKEAIVPLIVFEPGCERTINSLIKKLKPLMLKIRKIKPVDTGIQENGRKSVLIDPRKHKPSGDKTLTADDLIEAVPGLEEVCRQDIGPILLYFNYF